MKQWESIDYNSFLEGMKKINERDKGKNILRDLQGVSKETLSFFSDLLNAKSTSELDKYSDALLEESMSILYESEALLAYLSGYLEDNTILSSPSALGEQIRLRRVRACRRLL